MSTSGRCCTAGTSCLDLCWFAVPAATCNRSSSGQSDCLRTIKMDNKTLVGGYVLRRLQQLRTYIKHHGA